MKAQQIAEKLKIHYEDFIEAQRHRTLGATQAEEDTESFLTRSRGECLYHRGHRVDPQ